MEVRLLGWDVDLVSHELSRLEANTVVLIWHKNPPPPMIHVGPACPALAHSVIPQSFVRYRGPRSAGWLTFAEAQAVPGIRLCRRCL
jgi:hypothetical protein